jgi:Protein of unknown function (DUF998)
MAATGSGLHARDMTHPAPAYASRLALATCAAQVLFVGAWLVVGAVEGHGYQPMRHDISDLGALTAHHATAFRLALLLAGAVTMAFGLLLVGPVLRSPLAGVLVALSLVGLDNLTDAFFRLDCRAADVGCGTSDAFSSWHARAHLVCFLVAALATVAAPFVAAGAMSRDPKWRPAARPTRRFGYLTIALLVASAAASGSSVQGLAQRVAATVIPIGVAGFAAVFIQHQAGSPRLAGLLGGR